MVERGLRGKEGGGEVWFDDRATTVLGRVEKGGGSSTRIRDDTAQSVRICTTGMQRKRDCGEATQNSALQSRSVQATQRAFHSATP